ncbi:carbon-nitrogen hydrolase family protein [Paenarthrobacter nitroguajacolicus]|uniref:carbon-nitrogen hydrolase family protein n=1 Tax=Paenarthrobacter nitroguajacolicus TaxID=211146 RepID=UPI00248B850B|nr:carbon-nitrogen hydrolase family protein [Paenarthrobacter nitroguajacolicus]MDI2036467.1 Nitrilase [Paenarthrobacter nitroguajacolicus]
MDHPKFKAAAIQAAPVFLNLDATINKAVALIEEASSNGAEVIAFPETWLPGYPWYAWLDAPALWLAKFGQRYFDNSLEYGTPQAERLAKAAKDNKIMVGMGLSERNGSSLYIAQWIIGNDGKTIAQRRKLKPTHVERTIYGEGDGSDLSVWDTNLGRVGGLCCWEHLQPLSKYAMYSQNEQLHFAAWPSFSIYEGGAYALSGEANVSASRVYALEGSCYVLAPTAIVSQEMQDEMCETELQKALLKTGGGYSRIFGPDGKQLHESLPTDQEGIIYADIDLGTISLSKAIADPAGHYSRPDATQLVLNKTSRRAVVDTTPDEQTSRYPDAASHPDDVAETPMWGAASADIDTLVKDPQAL